MHSSNYSLRYLPKRRKTYAHKNTYMNVNNCPNWKQPKCLPMSGHIIVHLYDGIALSNKKEQVIQIKTITQMNFTNITLGKSGQGEGAHSMIPLT